MNDKNNENDFEDIDFDEFDDDFAEDDELIESDDIDGILDEDAPFDEEEDPFSDDDLSDESGDDGWNDDNSEMEAADNKKSKSSSRLLLPLLAIIGLGAGGYYYYTQVFSASVQPSYPPPPVAPDYDMAGDQAANMAAASEQASPQADPQIDISLPMPSPISEPAEDGFAEEVPGQNNDAALVDIEEPVSTDAPNDPGVLTPMPNIAANNNSFEITENTSDITNEIPQAEATEPVIAENSFPDTQNPAVAEIQPAQNEDALEELQDIKAANKTLESKLSDYEETVAEKNEQLADLKAEINALQQQLSQNERELQNSRTKISELEKTVQKQPKEPEVEKSTQKAKTSATVSTSAPQKSAASQPEVKLQWELRSAQPGKAYIAIKNSNNVLVVSTGDTIQGIGRIQSVSIEDGLWVVRGTQGIIKQ